MRRTLNARLATLFGPLDANLRLIESRLGVRIRRRGQSFRVQGERAEVTEDVLKDLFAQTRHHELSPEQVHLCLVEHASEGGADGSEDSVIIAPQVQPLIGKNTTDAVRSGIVYGYAGQVDGIIGRLRAELGEDAPVIATGGLAHHLVPSFTETVAEVDVLLTLEGLRLIWERNQIAPAAGGSGAVAKKTAALKNKS